MTYISLSTGIALILVSLLFCAVSIVTMINPAGTKMADDNDPFGEPPNRASSLAILAASVGLGVAGHHLVRRSF